MNKRNYQLELDKVIEGLADKTPTLLLHSCCAPCSSYVIEYLSQFFSITVLYYNPNIAPQAEYAKRALEQQRFIGEFPAKNRVGFIEGDYAPNDFFSCVNGFEDEPEGGARCHRCYKLRLEATAKIAKAQGFDCFASTLSISPLKSADKLNEIGEQLQTEYGVVWLPNDFKKREGFKRSIELSKMYELYRQNYCGCVYSNSH